MAADDNLCVPLFDLADFLFPHPEVSKKLEGGEQHNSVLVVFIEGNNDFAGEKVL